MYSLFEIDTDLYIINRMFYVLLFNQSTDHPTSPSHDTTSTGFQQKTFSIKEKKL